MRATALCPTRTSRSAAARPPAANFTPSPFMMKSTRAAACIIANAQRDRALCLRDRSGGQLVTVGRPIRSSRPRAPRTSVPLPATVRSMVNLTDDGERHAVLGLHQAARLLQPVAGKRRSSERWRRTTSTNPTLYAMIDNSGQVRVRAESGQRRRTSHRAPTQRYSAIAAFTVSQYGATNLAAVHRGRTVRRRVGMPV